MTTTAKNQSKDNRALKALRFNKSLLERINKAQGAKMQETGETYSFQQFCMTLIDQGLKKFGY